VRGPAAANTWPSALAPLPLNSLLHPCAPPQTRSGKFIIHILDETHLFVKADKVDFVRDKVSNLVRGRQQQGEAAAGSAAHEARAVSRQAQSTACGFWPGLLRRSQPLAAGPPPPAGRAHELPYKYKHKQFKYV
jgi:hypothetical protein